MTDRPISSSSNKRVKVLRKLIGLRGRKRGGLAVVEGPAAVETAVSAGVRVSAVFFAPDICDAEVTNRLRQVGAEMIPVSVPVISGLSDTVTTQGIIAVVETGESADFPLWWEQVIKKSHGPTLLLACHRIQDPGNVGTLIRTAHAAAAAGIVVSGESADPYAPKTIRSAAGWVFHLPVFVDRDQEVIAHARSIGLQVAAAVADGGIVPWSVDLRRPTAVVVGSEAHGLPDHIVTQADVLVTVPMPGGTESLNVAVTASMMLYEAVRQRSSSPTR